MKTKVSHPLVTSTETVVEIDLDPDDGDVSPNDTQSQDLEFLAIDWDWDDTMDAQQPQLPNADAIDNAQQPQLPNADAINNAQQSQLPNADAIDNAQQPQLPNADDVYNSDSDATIDYDIEVEQWPVQNFALDTLHPEDEVDWPVNCPTGPADMTDIHDIILNDFTKVITGYQGPAL